jgi:hypothetical protein
VAKARSPREKLEALLRATIAVVFKYRKNFVVMLRELHHVESNKRRAFFALAAEQRKYIQKILRDVSKETPLLMEHPLITANILVYLPKLIVSRGWDMKNEVDDHTISEALVVFMQRGLGLRKEHRVALVAGKLSLVEVGSVLDLPRLIHEPTSAFHIRKLCESELKSRTRHL